MTLGSALHLGLSLSALLGCGHPHPRRPAPAASVAPQAGSRPDPPVAHQAGAPAPGSNQATPAGHGTTEVPTRAASGAPSDPARACADLVGAGAVKRTALARAAASGLGLWLRGVEAKARQDGGRFKGWEVLRLHDSDPCFARVGIARGDIVVRINGQGLERPEEAHRLFESLPKAGHISIDLIRAGVPHNVRLRVVDDAAIAP